MARLPTATRGGGIAVLVILGVVIAGALAYVGWKRWRRRAAAGTMANELD